MDKTFAEKWIPGRFTLLLCLLPTVFLIAPLLGDSPVARLVFNALVTLLLLITVQATALKKKERIGAWLLVGGCVLLRWTGHVFGDARLQTAGDILAALFLGFVTVELFLYVVRAARVNMDVLSAGLCVYLLLGMTFALIYTALDRIAPASFALPSDPVDHLSVASMGRIRDYVYYSMVTMTTTGFGDIRPVSQLARSLTIIEILLGQLYLVVMISRLVSTWGSGRSTEN